MKRSNATKSIRWVKDGDCFRCVSHKGTSGYPVKSINHERITIPRLILRRRLGHLPDRIVARHTCDNRWCIRPDHIISGTQADNMADMSARGRHPDVRGEKNSRARLTDSIVIEIRGSEGYHTEIAKRFSLDPSTVCDIRNHKTWRHI